MLIVTLIYSFISILGVGTLMSPILEKLDVSNKPKKVAMQQPQIGDVRESIEEEDEID